VRPVPRGKKVFPCKGAKFFVLQAGRVAEKRERRDKGGQVSTEPCRRLKIEAVLREAKHLLPDLKTLSCDRSFGMRIERLWGPGGKAERLDRRSPTAANSGSNYATPGQSKENYIGRGMKGMEVVSVLIFSGGGRAR